jgi:hypothetical protein
MMAYDGYIEMRVVGTVELKCSDGTPWMVALSVSLTDDTRDPSRIEMHYHTPDPNYSRWRILYAADVIAIVNSDSTNVVAELSRMALGLLERSHPLAAVRDAERARKCANELLVAIEVDAICVS